MFSSAFVALFFRGRPRPRLAPCACRLMMRPSRSLTASAACSLLFLAFALLASQPATASAASASTASHSAVSSRGRIFEALHTHAPAAAGGGSAAEVLSKAFVNATLSRETHRAAEGTSFLKLVNQACDGAQEREVGGDMDTQTEAGMARSVEYCRGQCLGSAACRCFNLHNTTCSLHEGALTSTAMAGSSAYVRVAEKVVAAEPVDDGKGGKVGGGAAHVHRAPGGQVPPGRQLQLGAGVVVG